MNLFEYAIARRYAQVKADPHADLRELLNLELIVNEYEEREKLEDRYQPLRPPLAMGGGE